MLVSYKVKTNPASETVDQSLITTPLRQLLPNDRRALGRGPVVEVLLGNKVVSKASKRAFIAHSPTFNDILNKHPQAGVIMFNPAEVSESALETIIGYMHHNSFVKNVFALAPPESYVKTAVLYQQALLFGMEAHVGVVYAKLMCTIKDHNHNPFLEVLDVVAKLPYDKKLYQATVCRVAAIQRDGRVQSPQIWEAWLEQHQEFKTALDAWVEHKKEMKEKDREDRRLAAFKNNFPVLGS